jgi:hypothetical protein
VLTLIVKYGTILPRFGQLGARYLEQILKDDKVILGASRIQAIDVLWTDDQAVRVILDQHAYQEVANAENVRTRI